MNNLMKQAQAVQARMKKAQAEIELLEVTGESGGGIVKVTMTGKHEVKRVQIEPTATEDREMLEDLIAAAANDACHKVDALVQQKMSALMPAGMKLPF